MLFEVEEAATEDIGQWGFFGDEAQLRSRHAYVVEDTELLFVPREYYEMIMKREMHLVSERQAAFLRRHVPCPVDMASLVRLAMLFQRETFHRGANLATAGKADSRLLLVSD